MSTRILLVEDAEANRCLFQDFLELRGYSVQSLMSGQQFFQTIASFQPSLILLDLKLPDVDGYTLLEQLQGSRYGSTPAIVVSAYSFKRERQKALSLGARAYLTKPVSPEAIVHVIDAELHRSRATVARAA